MRFFRTDDGAELAYDDGGRGAVAVLFFHGWQGNRSVWGGVIASLGDAVRAVDVDLRGSGDSNAAPGAYALERYSADLQELLAFLGIESVVVVGHSMGAKVALRLAIDAPSLVRALILVAPVPAGRAEFSAKGEAYLRATAGDPDKVKAWLARTLADPAASTNLQRLCAAAGQTPATVAVDTFTSWTRADLSEQARAIRLPTLVIASENDDPDGCKAKVSDLIPGAQHVVLPGAAHYAIVEDAPAVAAAIRDFLQLT